MIGYLKSVQLARDVDFWAQAVHFVRYSENAFRYLCQTNMEMLQAYNRTQRSFSPAMYCERLCADGADFPNAWVQAVNVCVKQRVLPKNAAALLLEFGAGLGVSDLSGQLNHCAVYRVFCEEKLTAAQAEKNKKARMFVTLGVLLGLGVDLLLI